MMNMAAKGFGRKHYFLMAFCRYSHIAAVLVVFSVLQQRVQATGFSPTWESLDNRTLPAWYDQSKFGIFIHWGVFSVPAFETEWFWWVWKGGYDGNANPKGTASFEAFVNKTEPPNFGYQDYAHRFTAELWDPDHWADIFARSGAQYVVLTSKHHEGFCNWDSRNLPHTWNWNAMDIGPRRDLVGDLSKAVKNTTSPHTKQKLHFGLYHSLFEWFNPLYRADLAMNFSTQLFPTEKTMPELYDLVTKYEPEIIWSDGAGRNTTSDYWNAKEFLAWYATNSTVNQTAVWNDRWGKDASCKHGSFRTCSDKFRPKGITNFKYENCYTIDKGSWGFNRKAGIDAYESTKDLIHLLIETVAFNGNLLLNVGPGADGTLSPIFQDRLVEIGKWLTVNGEAIYQTTPWKVCQNETAPHLDLDVFYTTKNRTLFAIFRQWPENDKIRLTCPLATDSTRARMLGLSSTKKVLWSSEAYRTDNYFASPTRNERKLAPIHQQPGLELDLPKLNPYTIPCDHAWVIELSGIGNM